MPAHGYVRPGEAEAARRAAKRAVQRRHAELWKDRRAEGLSFAEEGWALWYTDEAKLIREEERRKVAKEIAAEIERVIGGYPDNGEVRPKVERGGFLDDADWAAQIARRVGQGDCPAFSPACPFHEQDRGTEVPDHLSGLIDEMSPEEKVLVLEYFTRDREEFLYAASEARKRYERARKHHDARPGECGAVSPRDKSQWCREPEGHTRDHSPVASPPSVCGVLLNPPDPYTCCRLPAGHDRAVECTQNTEEQP